MTRVSFKLNGRPVSAEVEVGETVVQMLTERFGLRGARESCGQGLCGCCTVEVDEQLVTGCLHLAALLDGSDVLTVEGLAGNGELDPVQEAFLEAGAFQCGFCTPGFVMTVRRLLRDVPNPSDDDIRHYLAGNLCRCSAYPEIMAAVRLAARRSGRPND